MPTLREAIEQWARGAQSDPRPLKAAVWDRFETLTREQHPNPEREILSEVREITREKGFTDERMDQFIGEALILIAGR